MFTLDKLNEGEKARVIKLKSEEDIRRRFLDIGLVEGTEVTCIQKSPCGNPVAYLIRGALIAIRCEDAEKIIVV